jgi:ATP-dependent DNA ligase
MALPVRSPFSPMEALSVDQIPVGKHWQYEPKWDGFRCIIFRGGKKVELQSKSGRTMTRYFPELVATVGGLKPKQFVLDGEIVVPAGGAFSFDALLQRIHPAASRVKRLSVETPAMLIVFDLLVGADGRSLTPFHRVGPCPFLGQHALKVASDAFKQRRPASLVLP